MDKNALKNYALWAREELEDQIVQSLKILGIHSDNDIDKALVKGDLTIIENNPNSYDKGVFDKRKQIINLVKTNGYMQTIEELAYTWFNRLIALKFMEVHDYLPHGFRVLSSSTGSIEPDILKNLLLVSEELDLDINHCKNLKSNNKLEDLYRYIFFKQCNALSGIIPMLFSNDLEYLELLLPQKLLKGKTVITELNSIDEKNFLQDVEVIGWLYQYYIQQKKDKVFKGLKNNSKVNKDTLPAATQIFTPEWIVKYMVENSLGDFWANHHRNSPIIKNLKYYLGQKSLSSNELSSKDDIEFDIESITFLDNCCGSGHILVYAFDLFYEMYMELGYDKDSIPELIIVNNLFGMDIDKRAVQMANFALTMKARKHDSRCFEKNYHKHINVVEIKETNEIDDEYIEIISNHNVLTQGEITSIKLLMKSFIDAKLYGSLITILDTNYELIYNKIIDLYNDNLQYTKNLFDSEIIQRNHNILLEVLKQALIFNLKYDFVITNPPYLGNRSLGSTLGNWLKQTFPKTKSDLFSAFIERNFSLGKKDGYIGFMSPFVWMFIKSYQPLREMIISNKSFHSLVQLEYGGFSEAIVPICTFVLKNESTNVEGVFVRLNEFKGANIQGVKVQEASSDTKSKFVYKRLTSDFKKLPGYPISYWISEKVYDIYNKSTPLNKIADVKVGLQTGNNENFLRLWYEIDSENAILNSSSIEESANSNKKWFPYNKGGSFRKWYGNNDFVVNWKNEGHEIRNNYNAKKKLLSRPQNIKYYFRESITWSKISSGSIAFRYKPFGHIFDVAGTSLFSDKETLLYLLALNNSKVVLKLLEATSPTLNFEVGHISNIPIIDTNNTVKENIIKLSKENIEIAKKDWNLSEISWNFTKHILIENDINYLIKESFTNWSKNNKILRNTLKDNEEVINKEFIKLYGLENEMDFKINDKDITIKKASKSEEVKSLLSYFVGIVFGRYSLDEDGLIYAGGEFDSKRYNTYRPVDNGIVALYDMQNVDNDLVSKIVDLLKIVFGEEKYRDNLDFIVEALGRKSSESSYDTLHRYLLNDFYKDHIKTYQKRPIYWMFSSGKTNAFKTLVYLHRYEKGTLANINTKLFLPHSYRIKKEIDSINSKIDNAQNGDKPKLEKLKKICLEQQNEMMIFGQVLEHKAYGEIELDLDDGVKVNYEKFQNIEIATESGGKIKFDLLEPLK